MPIEVKQPKLTDAQKEELAPYLRAQTKSMEDLFPDNMDTEKIGRLTEIVGISLGQVDRAKGRLTSFIGRLLVLVKANPELITNAGFDKFEDFKMDLCKRTHMSRSNVQDGMAVVSSWGNLEVQTYESVGVSNLRLLAKFTDQTSSDSKKWLEKGAALTYDQLKAEAIKAGKFSGGDVISDTLVITGSKTVIARIQKHLKNPIAAGGSGCTKDAEIIEAALATAITEWKESIENQ